ncbi:MAG: hypothetical protein JWQ90_5050 [Hydrocarboniphaga sp.]|uniref:hypothetical protein n=1 Tax=Hydrocarboniphaga sp. TaxID=2033016 RepID=UPI00260B0900|nr:hypothetical protein [Hydrocarboniphaga sp.]MDB5972600.1 hypothetical protein [Hydrocarboniphaga sp.]
MKSAPAAAGTRVDTRAFLEKLPKWVIVILPVAHWVLMSLRHRAAVLPSVANPKITSGGLVGEGKTEYFRIMGVVARAVTAPNGSFVVHTERAAADAAACMQAAGLAFPIIAKPDIGWCGFGVRRIDAPIELADYLAAFPRSERVVLQAYVPDAGEAGVFYVRLPGETRGRVLGLALRYFPQVIGDGRHSIAELIAGDARLARLGDPLHRSRIDPARIAAAGEVVRLATIGSSRVGGLYRNGEALITPQLTTAIDAVARDMDEFHFGRFDLRYASEVALMEGRGFTIIEVNGAGSEAIEAWDPQTRPLAAFGKIMAKQVLLFRIAAANRKRGFEPMGFLALAKLHLNQQRLIPLYPPSN